jgi:general secretion pathway protein D
MASLCILTGGCTQGFGTYNRDVSPVARPAGASEASDGLSQSMPQPVGSKKKDESLTAQPLLAGSAGSELTLSEAVEPISTEGSESAPLPAQYAQAPISKPEIVPLPQGTPAAKGPSEPKPVAPSDGTSQISLHADNLEIRKVLEMVSRQGNLNVLVSPGVKGTVTLDIRDKTMDEALQAIAKLCGLEIRREKSFVYVSTSEEVRQGEENDLPARVYRLNYVRSADVEKMVKPLLSKKGQLTSSPDSDVGLASDAAGAAKAGNQETAKEVKAGGNSMAGGEIVVVQDYEAVLKTIDRIIAQIDVQPVQVLIEAVIVSVHLDKGMELGVNFGLIDGAQGAMGIMGSGAAINAATGFVPAQMLAAGKLASPVNSGFSTSDNGLKFGFVDKSTTGFIRALETMGETKVLASPRLLVLNKQRAEIHLGDQLGYKTSTQTQTSTTETVNFMPVGTQLRLRPFVSSDGMVRLEVHPERSSGELQGGIPQTHAQQVTTNVMVPDGATIVIGGLIDDEVTHGWDGLPLLSRLPWVGYLFRNTIDSTKKRELIIILTPHIWRPECPEAVNYTGRPRTLRLDERVAQTPREESRDAPSLYELTRPGAPPCPQGNPPANTFPAAPIETSANRKTSNPR